MKGIADRELRKKLEQFSNLPSIPQVIVKIKQVSEDPKSTVADLANVILSDHQLTTRILRMSNSAYYGDFSGSIDTVTQAIVLMGFRAVRNIAISMGIYGMVNNLSKSDRFDLTAFWTRSLTSGVICKFLAHRMGESDLIEAAFIAGFMHDIGQVILAGVFPKEYSQICNLATSPPNIYATEQAVLGIDHLEAGGHVAKKWNLPEGLVKVISEHHRVNESPGEKTENLLVDIVYLSDKFTPFLMSDTQTGSRGYVAVTEEACDLLAVSPKVAQDMLSECRSQVSEIARELEIDIDRDFGRKIAEDTEVDTIQRQMARKDVQLAFLQNVTGALKAAETPDQVLQIICETIYRGMQMGRVAIFAYDRSGESVTGSVGFGFESQQAVQALKFSGTDGFLAKMRMDGKPVSVVGESHDQYGALKTVDESDRLGADTFVAVPMKIAEVVSYVVFADLPNRDNPISDDHMRSIQALADQGVLSLERNLFKQAWMKQNPGKGGAMVQ